MPGEWIKMRGTLLASPKVIAISRHLQGVREFRDWLTPGGGGPMNGQIVSDEASRCVTVALLLRVWSTAREHGVFDGEDLIFPCIGVVDIDEIAGVSGFGEAMNRVGWAYSKGKKGGVVLPNFKEYNVPATDAERAKAYRERRDAASRNGRDALSANVTPREEKSRGEKKRREKRRFSPPNNSSGGGGGAGEAEIVARIENALESQT